MSRIHVSMMAALVCGFPLARAALAAHERSAPPAADPPSAAELLAALPDGDERRRFILDCTGCHTFRHDLAYPGGTPRSRESWQAAAASMITRFGPHSPFPVIGPDRDPAAIAVWLSAALPPQPPARTALRPALLGRGEFREYVLPHAADLPHDVAVDGSRVVITGMFTAQMYVLDPQSGAIDVVPTPAPNPRAIEIDAAGDWWVVLGAPRLLARRAQDGTWQTWDAGFYAHSVALAADGGVWLNGHFTHEPELVRRIDVATGEHRDFVMPAHPAFTTTTVPYEIRVAPDGAVWMSELQGNRIIRLDPRDGTTRAWAMPTSWSGPRRFDIGPDGVLWIPAWAANTLVRFDPRDESFTEFPLPVDATGPYIARWDARRGDVWIGTGAADMVFRFDPRTRGFRAYPLPSADQLVRHLVVDSASGDIWLAPGSSPGTVAARVVRLRPLD